MEQSKKLWEVEGIHEENPEFASPSSDLAVVSGTCVAHACPQGISRAAPRVLSRDITFVRQHVMRLTCLKASQAPVSLTLHFITSLYFTDPLEGWEVRTNPCVCLFYSLEAKASVHRPRFLKGQIPDSAFWLIPKGGWLPYIRLKLCCWICSLWMKSILSVCFMSGLMKQYSSFPGS